MQNCGCLTSNPIDSCYINSGGRAKVREMAQPISCLPHTSTAPTHKSGMAGVHLWCQCLGEGMSRDSRSLTNWWAPGCDGVSLKIQGGDGARKHLALTHGLHEYAHTHTNTCTPHTNSHLGRSYKNNLTKTRILPNRNHICLTPGLGGGSIYHGPM